ncbi:hypothetical protein [Anaerosalibacter massiliensis]|uniref:hypothetical protein n=1 Tax=Anaerosalibacter massiliensis TaxID=1347392 RepID=UPI0005B2A524|nr:hypothetical protein [Anaerosalibacter massiliensis]
MIEPKKAKLLANKGGSGGYTYRATLPVDWIRKMGLSEESRDIKLEFDGKQITIKNNEEEIKMLKSLLERAKVEIKKEMDELGYIDDSDNYDRFLDELARKLVEKELVPNENDIDLYNEKEGEIEELSKELLEQITEYMQDTYASEGEVDERGNYTGCYYRDEKGLKQWEEAMEEF